MDIEVEFTFEVVRAELAKAISWILEAILTDFETVLTVLHPK